MRPHANLFFLLLAVTFSFGLAHAGYWFQSGAISDSRTYNNNGASVQIQTITPQSLSSGSAAYWVGENLADGSFLQIGYLVENITGNYPSLCNSGGCAGYQNIQAGHTEWFYEYFPSLSTSTFLGRIGADDSAGLNGTFHTYGFYSKGDLWSFVFDGNVIGNVTLNTGSSGSNAPVAFAELANASSSSQQLVDITFKSLSYYKGGTLIPIPYGYSYVGYGVGSQTGLSNPYGVEELSNKINYFEVGSGLPRLANDTRLWSQGYYLSVLSPYGGINGTVEYPALANANLTIPRIIYISNGTRAVFVQWYGSGLGAYSGASNSTVINLESNITERAFWQSQYLLNVSSPFAQATGSGWYNPKTQVTYSISTNTFYANSSSRYNFLGWSNGQTGLTGQVVVAAPTLLLANWQHQYLVNATSAYGNVVGNGWYNANSSATLYVSYPVINISQTHRLAFFDWSNGSSTSVLPISVTGPVQLTANFRDQYRTVFSAVDAQGNPVVASLYLGNNAINGPVFLFSGVNYSVTRATYAGFTMPLNDNISINGSRSVAMQLPLYPLQISATDLFGLPLNASAVLQFENGTILHTYTGQLGTIHFDDVLYGSAIGNVTYSWITSDVRAADGNAIHLFFLSNLDLGVFAGIVIAAALAYVLLSRRMHRKGAAQH